jgi:pimeloyl-ACP methyl ester carboxylesterase
MRRGRIVLIALIGVLLAASGWVWLVFRADMAEARARVAAYAPVAVATPAGPVQTVDRGAGLPVLSIHGTGGGFDQGFEIAAGLHAAGYRVIAPSRFGYLGAPVPDRTDAAAQADTFAALLDRLGVERAVVTGTSAGAVTALHFAARHPDRTAALVLLVPAYFPPEQATPEPWSPLRTWAVMRALNSDVLFWAGLRLFPVGIASAVLATDAEVIERADPGERARLDAVMWSILPISARAEGLLLDAGNTAAPVPVDLSRITVPTLAVSAEDDRYRTAESARLIARGVAGAEVFIAPDGGHAWAGRNDEVQAVIAEFLARSVGGPRG